MVKQTYHPSQIILHWLVFLLVTGAFIAIELKGQYPKGSEPRELCKTIHGFFGQLIFAAMLLRLLIRYRFGVPKPITEKPLLSTITKSTHWLMYALLLTLPIMGLVFLQAGGKEVHFLSWTWPQLIEPDVAIKKVFKESHELLGNVLYFLIGFHALAGLFHHYILKNNALKRILNKI